MKRLILLILFSIFFQANAQYATIDAILTKLEEKKGINKNVENVNIDDKRFIQVLEFDDHTERKFIICNHGELTYVEIFDDKETGDSTANVFTGDYVKSKKNIFSIRANLLEGKPINIPITKTFLVTKLDNILYLIDINTSERWIEESAFKQTKKK